MCTAAGGGVVGEGVTFNEELLRFAIFSARMVWLSDLALKGQRRGRGYGIRLVIRNLVGAFVV